MRLVAAEWMGIERNPRKTSAVCAAVALFGVTCAADNGSDPLIGTDARWHGPDGDRTDVVSTFAGDEHCGWQSVTTLRLETEVVPPAHPGDQWRDYVRDVDAVLPSGLVYGELDLDAVLPENAERTGFAADGVELWLDPDDLSAVYLKAEESVEAWPHGDPGCD